jgi:hypothetical protein
MMRNCDFYLFAWRDLSKGWSGDRYGVECQEVDVGNEHGAGEEAFYSLSPGGISENLRRLL